MIVQKLKNQAGMTLIEILIVLAIIGGAMGMFVVNIFGGQEQAKVDQTKIKISQIEQQLKAFRGDNGFFPTADQGLEALVEKPTSGKVPKRYRQGGYLERVPKDEWDNDFSYSVPGPEGCKLEVRSSGPDGEMDTDDDISNCTNDEDSGDDGG